MFGLKRGVGVETISELFSRLHLEAHVDCSHSALKSLVQRLERTVVETAAAWEHEGIEQGEIRPIIGAVDEPTALAAGEGQPLAEGVGQGWREKCFYLSYLLTPACPADARLSLFLLCQPITQ